MRHISLAVVAVSLLALPVLLLRRFFLERKVNKRYDTNDYIEEEKP